MDPLEEQNRDTEHFYRDLFKLALFVIIIIAPLRLLIAEPYLVHGASMEPTFETGDYLIIDRLTYRLENPDRGDIVVFRYPEDPSKFFIKRIVGLPGETIEIQGKDVVVKNDQHPDGFIAEEPYITPQKRQGDFLTVKLKWDEYFVMGDNRDASSDSRVWGPLPSDHIVGRAFLRLYPLSEASVLPGAYDIVE